MLDIHCHILYSLDDGAKSIEESATMLKIANDDGIKKIYASPHYVSNYFEPDYDEIIQKVELLNSIAEQKNLDIKVFPGNEVMLDKNTKHLLKEKKIITLNNSKYILIELPMDNLPDYALDEIYELRVLGLIPILAHPERYKFIIDKPYLINDLVKEGCLIQINSGSIRGVFGKNVQKTARKLIEHGICSFVASDAHSSNIRKPKIKEALEIVKEQNKELYKNIENNFIKIQENIDIIQESEYIKQIKSIIDIIFDK